MVTKFFPASDVLLLHELGVQAIGENKDQEAGPKIAAVRTALRGNADLGTPSSGACSPTRLATSPATPTSSTPRPDQSLLRGLSAGAVERDRPLSVLIQVSLDGDTSRGGALPGDVPGSPAPSPIGRVSSSKGVMAIAPVEADPDASFAHLREVATL